ncbi:MAG: hypothetical protein R3F60_27400 [bacterium]
MGVALGGAGGAVALVGEREDAEARNAALAERFQAVEAELAAARADDVGARAEARRALVAARQAQAAAIGAGAPMTVAARYGQGIPARERPGGLRSRPGRGRPRSRRQRARRAGSGGGRGGHGARSRGAGGGSSAPSGCARCTAGDPRGAGDLARALARHDVERALVEARVAQADALGRGLERRCPDGMRAAVGAFLDLAVDRQRAGHDPDALAAVTRARALLASCAGRRHRRGPRVAGGERGRA